MSEKKAYRDNLADLIEFFGGRRLLTAVDVGRYLGIDRRTAARRYNIGKDGITAPTLARMLATF